MSEKQTRHVSSFEDRKYIIEEDLPDVGFYLLIFEGGICTMDYMQDTIKICKNFAEKKFRVPLDSWFIIDSEKGLKDFSGSDLLGIINF